MRYLRLEKKCWLRSFIRGHVDIHINRQVSIAFLFLLILTSMGISSSHASEILTFGPKETRIDGSIPYSVIGKYKAQFKSFKGTIILDNASMIQSVGLEIEVNSITSNCPWCDKIVRSRKLLNTAKYPEIIFKSRKIIHDEEGFKVKGILEMHGIRKVMNFPFKFEIIYDRKSHENLLEVHGSWVINRKDFNIIWNKLLDRGGLLVGDEMTVKWGIQAFLKREKI